MTLKFGLTSGDAGLLYATLTQNSTNITGWVCDDYFDEIGATAICNSMNGSYWFFNDYQSLTDEFDDFLIDDFICSATEDIYSHCNWTYDHNCYSQEGVYLDCGGPREWIPGPISFGLTEGDKGLLYTTVLNITGQEETGWVCDDGFEEMEGEALCTFMFGPNTFWSYAHQQMLSSEIYDDFELDDVDCTGDEDIWTQCTWSTQHNCWQGEGLFLDCGGGRTPPEAPNTENGQNSQGFGLTNGTTGILFMRNGWVCDDEFSEDSARIVCSEMGMGLSAENGWWTTYTTATSDSWNGYFGYNDFGMDDLNCPDTAEGIDDCTWEITHDCMYREGLWMNCTGSYSGSYISPRTSGSSMSSVEIGLIFTLVIVSGMLCIFGYWWFIMKKGEVAGRAYYRNFDTEDSKMDNLMQMTKPETGETISNSRGEEPDIKQLASENTAVQYRQISLGEPSEALGELSGTMTESELQSENERLKAELARYKAAVNLDNDKTSPPPAYKPVDEPLTKKL